MTATWDSVLIVFTIVFRFVRLHFKSFILWSPTRYYAILMVDQDGHVLYVYIFIPIWIVCSCMMYRPSNIQMDPIRLLSDVWDYLLRLKLMYSKCLVTKWPNCTILHLQYYNTIKYSVKTLSTDYIKNDIVERK